MAHAGRRRLVLALVALAAVTAGCNPITTLFLLKSGFQEPSQPAEFSLAHPDKKKEIKVVVLAYTSPGAGLEFVGVDRSLCNQLVRELQLRCAENKEKVTFVAPQQVERYKIDHPNWQSKGPHEIGKFFQADYVVDLEITGMSLFEPRSNNQLFRGRTEISVKVIEPRLAGEEPVFTRVYTKQFPSTGNVPVDLDTSAEKFRQEFLACITREMAWMFTASPVRERYGRE